MHEKALLGIILFPLIGAIVNGLFGRKAGRSAVHAIAVLSVAMSFGLAVYSFTHLVQLRHAGAEDAAIRYTDYSTSGSVETAPFSAAVAARAQAAGRR